MKTVTVVILILFSYAFAQKSGRDDKEKNIKNVENKNGYVNGDPFFDKAEKSDDDYDPGNPDNYETIVRPCAPFDRFCIRKFFAEHSKCKIVPGPIIEPFYITQDQIYLPNNNITTTLTDSEMTGLNGRIEDFYVNKATGNLVLALYFEKLTDRSRRAFFRFNRRGQEPVEAIAPASIDYLQLSVTIIIPNVNNLKMENAETFGFLGNLVTPFFIGPEVLENTDPTVVAEVASLLADVPTAAIENMPTVAPRVAKIFVQKNICDFGVPINRI